MIEIEKPGALEGFRGTVDKIKAQHIGEGSDFLKINSKDLGSLEMKNWEIYKKEVRDFYGELNLFDLSKKQSSRDIQDAFRSTFDQEEQLLRGMYRTIEAILKGMPVVYENSSKGFFYNWLKGRSNKILTYLGDIFKGHMPAVSLENMKNEMKQNIIFFDTVS